MVIINGTHYTLWVTPIRTLPALDLEIHRHGMGRARACVCVHQMTLSGFSYGSEVYD